MDATALRAAFPVLAGRAYLNAGTAGPVPAVARDAAADAWRRVAEEGRGAATFWEHLGGVRTALRGAYAAALGADDVDVALTTGTSEGIGRVITGLHLRPGDEVVTARDEHPGLQGPLAMARARGVHVREVALADVADAVEPGTRLVACSHVAWTTGALAPAALREIAARGVPVLLDGAQGLGAIDVDLGALGCSFYAASGQKWLCGAIGTGALWVAPAWRDRVDVPAPAYPALDDVALGLAAGPAPGARRFDTPAHDLPALAASLAAIELLAEAGHAALHARAAALAAMLADALRDRGLEVAHRDATPLVAWTPPDDPAATALRLTQDGIVLRDLPGTGRLRASVGAWNDEEDLRRLLGAL